MRLRILIAVLLVAVVGTGVCKLSMSPQKPIQHTESSFVDVPPIPDDFWHPERSSPIPNADTSKSYVMPIPSISTGWQ
jgi:hypothetical protein